MFAELPVNEGGSVIFALILALLVTYFFLKRGFFYLEEREYFVKIPARYPIFLFVLYFCASLFFGALVLITHKNLTLTNTTLAFLQIVSLYGIFITAILYLFTVKRDVLKYIFTGNPHARHIFVSFFKNIGAGALTWLVSYPVVLFVGVFTDLITNKLWEQKGVSQVAVEQLKKTFDAPLIFILLSLTIVFIVPFVEELLFRGFLQSYFRQRWGRNKAILFTALFFSVFHFSAKQGLGNIQLIISLFVLACYLGFIYEKQKSLWAPYGLHMTFNAISVIAIKLQS